MFTVIKIIIIAILVLAIIGYLAKAAMHAKAAAEAAKKIVGEKKAKEQEQDQTES